VPPHSFPKHTLACACTTAALPPTLLRLPLILLPLLLLPLTLRLPLTLLLLSLTPLLRLLLHYLMACCGVKRVPLPHTTSTSRQRLQLLFACASNHRL
jgi:hypothetical protein